jgi:hypothetical protein
MRMGKTAKARTGDQTKNASHLEGVAKIDAFAETENWGSPTDLLDMVGPVPSDVAQIDATEIEYPGLVRVCSRFVPGKKRTLLPKRDSFSRFERLDGGPA